MSPDVQDELAELRRRAYGPDADIAADPAALARLRALEASERDGTLAAGSATAAPVGAPEPQAARAELRRQAPEHAESAPRADGDTDRPAPAAAPPAPGRISRRLGVAWAVSLVLAGALGAGLMGWGVASGMWDPTPHAARLGPQEDASIQHVVGNEDVEFRSFGDYLGLRVFAGGGCLQVIFGAEGAQSGTGTCAGDGLATVLDVQVPAAGTGGSGFALPDELTERYPEGANVRFTHQGDVVVVDVGGLPAI